MFKTKIIRFVLKWVLMTLYPLIYVYFRFFKIHFQEMFGMYVKSRIKSKGFDLKVHGYIEIHDVEKLEVGDFCRIGKGAFLFCKGGLSIGNNVQMSRNITIYTANHNFNSHVLPYDNEYVERKVVVEDNVWIGMNVSILPGVRIGENSIIGMGAIITKDVPKNSIVVGNNKIIKYRQNINENFKQFGKIYPNS